eukprot:1195489-Prorocentrum_minimum.AAC.13
MRHNSASTPPLSTHMSEPVSTAHKLSSFRDCSFPARASRFEAGAHLAPEAGKLLPRGGHGLQLALRCLQRGDVLRQPSLRLHERVQREQQALSPPAAAAGEKAAGVEEVAGQGHAVHHHVLVEGDLLRRLVVLRQHGGGGRAKRPHIQCPVPVGYRTAKDSTVTIR